MRKSFPAQSLRSIHLTPLGSCREPDFNRQIFRCDSLFLEGTNRIWTTWTVCQELLHSACLTQSLRASGPHQDWKSHPRKQTGHPELVGFSEQLQEEPWPWKSRGTSEIRKFSWSVVQWIKSPYTLPNNIWRCGLLHLRAWLLQKNQAFICFSILVKCWNVYRQRLKQFSWTVLQVNCKNSYTDFYKNEFKRKALVDLPRIFSLHFLH